MQNVLILPTLEAKKNKNKKSMLDRMKNLFSEIKQKRQREYQNKVEFLKEQTYNHYLRDILQKRYDAKEVDFPAFMYEQRLVICRDAMRLTDFAIRQAEAKGKRHIESYFKECLKQIQRENECKQRRILKSLCV